MSVSVSAAPQLGGTALKGAKLGGTFSIKSKRKKGKSKGKPAVAAFAAAAPPTEEEEANEAAAAAFARRGT